MSWFLTKKIYPIIFFVFIQGSVFSQTTLFSFGSDWKYKDDGSNQGTAWRQVGFDDSSWSTGVGQFGYGKTGLTTILNACGTPVQYPSCSNKYIGYYFRKIVTIPDVSLFKSFTFEMYRDDGVVVYVNGAEVYRNNMPAGTITYNTLASANAPDDGNSTIAVTLTLAGSQLLAGNNEIAVEVHQSTASSSDTKWDMKLTGIPPGLSLITRGPYLQKPTSTSMLVRWYTDDLVDSEVKYGTDPGNLSQSVVDLSSTNNHSVQLTNLTPYTKYYYSVGSRTTILKSGLDNYFLTSPAANSEGKYTFWVTGDVGNNSTRQRAVRDRFNAYMGSNITNGWLLLGDNAYDNGTESVYTTNFFEIYDDNIMGKTPLWPATGNHEYANSTARQIDHNIPYFGIFDLPTNAEAGGVPSNSEAYYSFDYGNIHFVALDSYIIENGTSRLYDISGPQVQWLKLDLAANDKKWTIVYFHHPPFTMGSHNSDTEDELRLIRENVVPILEQYDVDLVLSGHSHDYERSKLMKGHFGLESTFDPLVNHLSQSSGKYDGTTNSCTYTKDSPSSLGGTIYTVAGSGGKLDAGQASFPHDAMYYGNQTVGGSLILEIEANRLDVKWLSEEGIIRDNFTIMKKVNKVNNINLTSGQSTNLEASWVGQYDWGHSTETSRIVSVTPATSTTYTVTDQYLCLTDTYNINVIIASLTIDIPSISFTEICAGENVSISYATSGVFSAGNVFTLQLSDAAGSFASPITIGSVISTASGTINGVIPGNTPGGGNFRLRVASDNPVFTGSQSSTFIVSAPVAPSIGTIVQPTCSVATGSVPLSGLPSSGTWTLTRSPGGITSAGTGTSTTISGLAAGTYTYTVTNSSTCVSASSANIVINAQPVTPTAPTVGTITQPTCSVATGSVVLNGLPSSGTWTLTKSPGGITSIGTGTNTTISGLATGTYTYTVTNASGCVSVASINVVINASLSTPPTPTVETITQPTCAVATGSVVLNNLPSSGTWTLTRTPGGITTTGTGTSTTLSGLVSGTYTYTVTNTLACISAASADVVIHAQPATPVAPIEGTITQPTCSVTTGSVTLYDLPSSGTWTLTRTPGGVTTTGTGTSTTVSGLAAGTYTYTVTNESSCVSPSSANLVINIQPATPEAPTATVTSQPTCSVATGIITVTVPAPGGAGVSFTVIGTTPAVAAQNNTTGIFPGLAAGNYDVTTTVNGCTSVATALTVNTEPLTPTAPTVSDIAYCRGATALTATALSGHTLLWYGTAATGGTSSTTAPITMTATAGTTNYYVSQRNTATNCESDRASITVTIKSVPKPTITATGIGTENVLLNSSASNGNQWFKDGIAIAGATSQSYLVLGNGIYQVNATVEGCISELSEPFTVIVTAVEDVVEPISLKLFPVPAHQAVNIHLTGVKDDEVSEVMIFDMSGRAIDQQSMRGKESTLVIEEYPAGEYFLRISSKSFLLNSRIVKY